MLYFLKDKKDCSGCTACVNVCPVNCISMKQDKEGFYYPYEDDRCIHCRKCEHVCPINTDKTEGLIEIEQHAVAAVTKNQEVWNASTSGGAFSEICNSFGDNETVVFGARFEKLKVIHDHVIGISNIDVFRKSKYVQSDLGSSLSKAEAFLKRGQKVIFSGTPCQIAGFKSYLGKDYDNLLTIDLICHGVGSPKIFNEVVQYIENKYKKSITGYTFRAKRVRMGNFKLHTSKYEFFDHDQKYVEKDEYNQLFLNQLCLRPSCGSNCRFRSSNRLSDITIADFKNKLGIFPELTDYKNYSTIVINSKKGESVFNKLNDRMKLLPCDIEDIKKFNPLFFRHTEDNLLRNDFFRDYTKGMAMTNLINKYVSTSNSHKKSAIRDFIPYKMKLWYIRLKRR